MMRRAMLQVLPVLAAGSILSGCSGPSRFVDPEADLPYYEVVGVVPFQTLADDRAAGLRVSSIFFTQLLDHGFAQVQEPGQFQAAIRELRGAVASDAPWSSQDLVKLGEKTGVQGVFLGTVHEYGMRQEGRNTIPVLSLEIHLVDVATGRVVWNASDTRRGSGGTPIFGFGKTRTLGELTSEVCASLLETLPRE